MERRPRSCIAMLTKPPGRHKHLESPQLGAFRLDPVGSRPAERRRTISPLFVCKAIPRSHAHIAPGIYAHPTPQEFSHNLRLAHGNSVMQHSRTMLVPSIHIRPVFDQ
jgi:hypothetical protein